jgi:hypothetical protein
MLPQAQDLSRRILNSHMPGTRPYDEVGPNFLAELPLNHIFAGTEPVHRPDSYVALTHGVFA